MPGIDFDPRKIVQRVAAALNEIQCAVEPTFAARNFECYTGKLTEGN